MLFFFFSSRRRHTRSKRDWSSDVCSSDLQLSRTLFPLGEMTKPEVRELARKLGLALAEKPDSQEICFIPGGDYKRFLDAYLEEQGEALPDTAGELVTTSGEVIGEHHGIHNFTVGQRRGLGVATGSLLYVIQIKG